MHSRILLCLLVLSISLSLNSQVFNFPWTKNKVSTYVRPVPKVLPVTYFVTDTAVIAASVRNTGDTNYYFRNPPVADTFIVYYDESKSQLALRKIIVAGFRYNSESWYRNGKMKKTEMNVDDLPWNMHNTEEWYDNGKRKSSLTYSSDSCIYLEWWPNGNIAVEKRVGGSQPWEITLWAGQENHYETDCRLSESIIYSKDSALRYSYYYNGKLSRVSVTYPDSTIEGGIREHYRMSYYANGKKMHSPFYPDSGRQQITYYYLSGRIKSRGEWENGNDGDYKKRYDTPSTKKRKNVKEDGEYSATNSLVPHTRHRNYFIVKTGHWMYYDEAGKKSREEWYHPDHSMEFIIYDNTGKEKSKGKEELVLPQRILL
ncbi:MAG: hypothetical protein M3R17_05065 [Bacteroidota bacterium]|nr:hypothetical protein [Bacteroidota bacterium]